MEIVYICVIPKDIPKDIAVKKGLIKRAPLIAEPFTTDGPAGTLRTVLARHDAAAAG